MRFHYQTVRASLCISTDFQIPISHNEASTTEHSNKKQGTFINVSLAWYVAKGRRRHVVNGYHVSQNSRWKRVHRHFGSLEGNGQRLLDW